MHEPQGLLRLNLGCGLQTPAGWVNVDYSVGAMLAKLPGIRALRFTRGQWDPRVVLADLRRAFPWRDGAAQVIYSSHTLEHLSAPDGARFLEQSYRVLAPGGVIRIVVPDLRAIVDAYVRGEIPAERFVDELGAGYQQPGDGFIKRLLAPVVRAPHKCMYDEAALLAALRRARFDARPRAPFDSDIPDIRLIELESRTRNAVIVEGRKVG